MPPSLIFLFWKYFCELKEIEKHLQERQEIPKGGILLFEEKATIELSMIYVWI